MTGRGVSRKKHRDFQVIKENKNLPEHIQTSKEGLEKIVDSKPVVDNIVRKLSMVKLPKPKKVKLEI